MAYLPDWEPLYVAEQRVAEALPFQHSSSSDGFSSMQEARQWRETHHGKAPKDIRSWEATLALARIDICNAIADRKVNIRVRIAASEHRMVGRIFSGGNVGVPAHLKPDDFNFGAITPFGVMANRARAGPALFFGWRLAKSAARSDRAFER